MKTENRYCFVQDQDCHWYIVPAEHREAADKYFDDTAKYWEEDHMHDGVEPPDEPAWLERINSPFGYSFTDPKEAP